MKQNYNKQIKLLCSTCGSGVFFDKNEETGVITCKKCNRVYYGGYDEIVDLNQQKIDAEMEKMKQVVKQDLKNDISNIIKKSRFKIK